MTATDIARVAHEANRAYCAVLGDHSQSPWAAAPQWQRDSAVHGVESIHSGAVSTPREAHASWHAQKLADGWIYGERKDSAARTHPCMLPYDDLPLETQLKDALFHAVTLALLPGLR